MPNISIVDVIVGIFVLLVASNGWRSGLLIELAGVLRLVIGVVAGVRFFTDGGAWLTVNTSLPPVLANLISFIAIFLLTVILVTVIYAATIYPAVDFLHRIPGLGGMDRVLGVIPAAIQALFWASIALSALLLLPINPRIQTLITQSTLGNALVVDLSRWEPRLQNWLGNTAQSTLLYITPPATPTEGTVLLHFPPDLHLSEDTLAEQTMLGFVNQQRQQQGLAPLTLDPKLSAVALAHSEDMFRHSYFSHNTPNGLTPFDRMHQAGITYTTAGENIAYAPNVTIADIGLMNSPEHRANILHSTFTRVGIGIVSGGLFEEMFTQDFAN